MIHKRLWIAAAIIAFVLVVGFMLSIPHTRDSQTSVVRETAVVPVVKLRDAFKKGMHTITGTVEAPNACATVTASANLIGDVSSTQSILLAISMQDDKDVCLQLPSTESFSTTISAPEKLPIVVTVNGGETTASTL